jgi:Tol biopolymer transport system component
VYGLEDGKLQKLAGGGEYFFPRWAPDGKRLSFSWVSHGVSQIAWLAADGTAGPETLVRGVGTFVISSWSPDGRHLAFFKGGDIWIGTLNGSAMTAVPYRETPEAEQWPEFSPDGKWLAYGSNASGRFEIYVQAFPGPGPRHLISLHGGGSPAWNPAGRELFFVSPPDSEGKRQMMVAEVRLGPEFEAGRPRPLFSLSDPPLSIACGASRCYDVSPDGQMFYATQERPTTPLPPVTQIHLVQNFVEEVKARLVAGEAK